MYRGKRIIALIPARGGSKGLPKKNILPLSGTPLIVWTIGQAKRSKYLDTVFVSTDSKEIAEISRKAGIEVPFLRPAELAMDTSPTIDAISHTLDYFEKNGQAFDILVLLEPTSPLRKSDDIDNAIALLVDHGETADSLVSIGEVHMENPHITKVVTHDGYVSPFIREHSSPLYQRQQLPTIYFPYGVVYASKVSALRDKKTFYQEKTLPYFIERWQNYEIDDLFDFICVEAILNYKSKEAAQE